MFTGMMKVIYITSLLALLNVSCVIQLTKPQEDKKQITYKELQTRYYLAFEKHLYVNIDSLYQLDTKTREALAEKLLTSEQNVEIKKLHHKLKSYLVFLQIANPVDANGVIKTEVAAFFLDQLRQQSAEQIDLADSNEEFYQLMLKGQQQELTTLKKRIFVDSLLNKIIVMAEESATKHKLWAEGNGGKNLPKLTAEINDTIRRLNRVIGELNNINNKGRKNFLSFAKVDLTDPEIAFLNQQYEFILIQAANKGVLPIFFAESFKNHSGRVNLTSWEGVNNKPLVELSLQVTAKILQELKQKVSSRVQTINNFKKNSTIGDQEIYQLLIDNEVSVAQLILQSPQHSLALKFYIDRYRHKSKMTSTNLLKGVLTTVGVGTLLALGGSFFLPIGAVLGKALIISTVANFTWLGLSINDSIVAHNRYLAMEQAMLTGTSEQIKDNLDFLRKVEATRLRAILSGTIGLSLGASSLGPILRSIHNGTKPMQINALSRVVNPKGKLVFE